MTRYHPRNKEDCASLIASKFPVQASRDPENAGLDNEVIHNKIYDTLIKKSFSELKSMYYNKNLTYESIRHSIKFKDTGLEKVAKDFESEKSESPTETIRNYFEKLSRICGGCFEPAYKEISGIKARIELELKRVRHVNKTLYGDLREEYEMFREQYPILKKEDEKLILTG